MVGDEKHKDDDIHDEEDWNQRMKPFTFNARAQENGRKLCTYYSRYNVITNA